MPELSIILLYIGIRKRRSEKPRCKRKGGMRNVKDEHSEGNLPVGVNEGEFQ